MFLGHPNPSISHGFLQTVLSIFKPSHLNAKVFLTLFREPEAIGRSAPHFLLSFTAHVLSILVLLFNSHVKWQKSLSFSRILLYNFFHLSLFSIFLPSAKIVQNALLVIDASLPVFYWRFLLPLTQPPEKKGSGVSSIQVESLSTLSWAMVLGYLLKNVGF